MGTALDILSREDASAFGRIYAVANYSRLADEVLRLFAVDCARHALSTVQNPDPRSVRAWKVAEKFAIGQATEEELREARLEAQAAALEAESSRFCPKTAAVYDAVRYVATPSAAKSAYYVAGRYSHVVYRPGSMHSWSLGAAESNHTRRDRKEAIAAEDERQITVLKELIATHNTETL